MHCNEYSRVIIPLQTGVLEQVNSQGTYVGQRAFTQGVPFLSSQTNPENLHGNINRGNEPLAFLIVEVKPPLG